MNIIKSTLVVVGAVGVMASSVFASDVVSDEPVCQSISGGQGAKGEPWSTTRCLYQRNSEYIPAGAVGYIVENSTLIKFYRNIGAFEEMRKGPFEWGWTASSYTMTLVDVKQAKYTEFFDDMRMQDGLTVDFKAHFELQIRKDKVQIEDGQLVDGIEDHDGDGVISITDRVKYIVEEWGSQLWYEAKVRETLRNIVRQEAEKYESFDVNSKRQELSEAVMPRVREFLSKTPIELVNFNFGRFLLPKDVQAKIEEKVKISQEVEVEIERRKKLKEQKINAELQGEIDVVKAQKKAEAWQALQQDLTPEILQRMKIDAMKALAESPNAKIVFMGDDATAPVQTMDVQRLIDGVESGELPVVEED